MKFSSPFDRLVSYQFEFRSDSGASNPFGRYRRTKGMEKGKLRSVISAFTLSFSLSVLPLGICHPTIDDSINKGYRVNRDHRDYFRGNGRDSIGKTV